MSFDVDEVTESDVAVHSPTLPLLHIRHSSFSNPSFASPTPQALHLIHLASRPWFGEDVSPVTQQSSSTEPLQGTANAGHKACARKTDQK